MTIGVSSQNFESYVPVYDVLPEKAEDLGPFLTEQLKKISNGINIREIGWYLDQEVLTGKSFIPGINNVTDGGTSQSFRSILRMVVDIGPVTAGTALYLHGITNNANFTLIDLWATATNTTTLTSTIFCNSDTIRIIGPNIRLTSDGTYDRCFAFIEYLQEV